MDINPHRLDLLPKTSRAKFEVLLDERAAAHAAVRAAEDAVLEAARNLDHIEAEVRRKIAESGPIRYADERAILERPLDPARQTLARLTAARDRATAKWTDLACVERAGRWLSSQMQEGSHYRHIAPKPPKVRSYSEAVERVRAEIGELREQWDAAEAAPATVAEMRARTRETIENIAARGEPKIDRRIRSGDPFRLESLTRFEVANLDGEAQGIGDGGLPLMLWLHRDALIARLDNLIGSREAPGAMTDAERDDALTTIMSKLLDAARLEEALVVAAAGQGQTIPRRRDIDPRALLEIEEVDP